MSKPLQGTTVVLAEGRQLEELVQLLEKEGANAWRCPMVNILDAPDSASIVAWLHDLVSGRMDYLVLMTGEALKRLLGAAEREGMKGKVIEALAKVKTITRGPKPVRALKEIGLAPARIAESPTTEGVIATLKHDDLRGKTVGVTLYGEDNLPLVDFLEKAGATARTVLSYVFAPATDSDHIVAAIEGMEQKKVNLIVFTSSAQVDRLVEVAEERGMQSQLRQALDRVKVAAVGPILAETLREKGFRVDICPDQGFVMKNMVQLIKKVLGNDRVRNP